LQKFERREIVYSFEDYKVIFSCNKYNRSLNFVFDIQINNIRQGGKKILDLKYNDVQSGYRLYFELLALAIQNEIEPLFKHKGRFEDYYSWQKEFERLGLSAKAFDNDVMERLNDFKSGVHYR